MIPELGHFALILALCLAIVQATLPLIGTLNRTPSWVALARPVTWGQFFFLSLSLACLVFAFLVNDFSVTYVARNGNTLLPIMYKISAVWGAHEGSLLLWVFILGGWGVAVSIFSHNLPDEVLAKHDENYMPPEVMDTLKTAHDAGVHSAAQKAATP